MDEGTKQRTKEEIGALRKLVVEAYSELGSTQPPTDATNNDQVQSFLNQFMERFEVLLNVRQDLYSKQIAALDEFQKETSEPEHNLIKRMIPIGRMADALVKPLLSVMGENLLTSQMDNSLMLTLVTIVHTVIRSTSDLDSIRNRMSTYANIMSKFKTLLHEKRSERPTAPWFNLIWATQVKRRFIR